MNLDSCTPWNGENLLSWRLLFHTLFETVLKWVLRFALSHSMWCRYYAVFTHSRFPFSVSTKLTTAKILNIVTPFMALCDKVCLNYANISTKHISSLFIRCNVWHRQWPNFSTKMNYRKCYRLTFPQVNPFDSAFMINSEEGNIWTTYTKQL